MLSDGKLADPQCLGDISATQPLSDKREHLAFTLAQGLKSGIFAGNTNLVRTNEPLEWIE
jgi:hypothetical protein